MQKMKPRSFFEGFLSIFLIVIISLISYSFIYRPLKNNFDMWESKRITEEQWKQDKQNREDEEHRKKREAEKIEWEKELAKIEKQYQRCKESSRNNVSNSMIQRKDFNDCIDFWVDDFWINDSDYIHIDDLGDYVTDYVEDHKYEFSDIFRDYFENEEEYLEDKEYY